MLNSGADLLFNSASPTMLPPPRRPRLHVDTDEARADAASAYSAPFARGVQDNFSHFHTSVFRYAPRVGSLSSWRTLTCREGRTNWKYRFIARL